MKKTILVLGAGPFQIPLIRKSKDMGWAVAATDGNAHAAGLGLADFPFQVDLRDIEGCIRIARECGVSGVVSVAAEAAVRTLAAVAEALGLPGPSTAAARVATDKLLMRECFERHGVPSPAWTPCRTASEAMRKGSDIGWPVVVKPVDSAGSRGVSMVRSPEEIPAAFERALAFSSRKLVLMERFMPGKEISVESFVHRGEVRLLAMSDKIRTQAPYLLDTTVIFPTESPSEVQDGIFLMARQAIKATGLDTTPVHMEQILTPEGPRVVELAARGAGYHVFSDMIPWVTGVDVLGEMIRMGVGEEPNLEVRVHRCSILRFPESRAGFVRRISGFDEARQIPGMFDLQIYVKPGDEVRSLTSGPDRVGHMIAMADTRKEVWDLINKAENLLRIEVGSTPE